MSQLPPKPEVSSPFAPPKQEGYYAGGYPPTKTSGKAIASLVLGLLSFVCFLVTGLLGLIFGVLALRDIGKSQGRLTGSAMAIIGIITSVIGCFLSIFVLIALLLPAVQQVRETARRAEAMNRIREMAIGIHNFHDSHQQLPYASNTPEGRGSKLSWRVQILPFIEEHQLYDQFNQNEPWDSPHNLALVDQMPDIFKTLNHDLEPGMTNYVVPVTRMLDGRPDFANQTMFVPGAKTSLNSVADGTSRTIMILEVNPEAAVTWTKPEDWEFDPDNPMRDLGQGRPGGFCIAFGDCSTFFIDRDVSPQTIKEMFTARGGETRY